MAFYGNSGTAPDGGCVSSCSAAGRTKTQANGTTGTDFEMERKAAGANIN